MSMGTVICSKCGDEIVTTAKSITLPFVCQLCDDDTCPEEIRPEARHEVEALDQSYPVDMEEFAKKYGLQTVTCEPETVNTDEGDTSTIENTVELVADLQAQLEDANETIDDLRRSSRLGRSVDKICCIVFHISNLEAQLNEMVVTINGLLIEAKAGAAELQQRIDDASDKAAVVKARTVLFNVDSQLLPGDNQ